jgi:DNA-binding transcriptional regulator YiaG
MPRFAAVLQEEIRRLARKEVRALTSVTRRAASQHRREIAALKRQARLLIRQVAVLETLARRHAAVPSASEPVVEKARFSPSWIKTRRERLKLSAADYGRLMGVSGLAIYQWEHGKSRPRSESLAKLVAVRDMGRREALRRLEMLGDAKKPKARARMVKRRARRRARR